MTLQYADRVQETFTTTGTGALSLAGPVVGYQAFSAPCSNGDTCYYSATDGTNWEVGVGTYTSSGNTLTRSTILASSNGNNAVSWAAGTKNIWLTLPSAQVSQSFLGFRNRVINGDMRIDQRNAGNSQTISSPAYTVDRFNAAATGASVTGQRVAGSGAHQNLYQFTGAASVTNISFSQQIESTNIWDLEGQTVTLSALLANSLLATVTWTAYYPTATDNWSGQVQIATGTFTVNSTLTRYSAQIALPSNVTAGLRITLSVGAQISGTWRIGEVQLEPGSIATPFERRPIGIELALCQRYFETSYNPGVKSGTSFAVANASRQASASSGLNIFDNASYKATKFSAPTVTTYDSSGASGVISYYNGGWNNGGVVVSVFSYNTGFCVQYFNSGSSPYISYEWSASAEL